MSGTSTRVLPRICAMSAGAVAGCLSDCMPAGTPCLSKMTRTAVSDPVWLRSIPSTYSCVGDLPCSVLRPWSFH